MQIYHLLTKAAAAVATAAWKQQFRMSLVPLWCTLHGFKLQLLLAKL
jgi:hypothetical protein